MNADTPIKQLIDRAYNKLSALDPKELSALIEKHKNGPIARMLLETGALDAGRPDSNAFWENPLTEKHHLCTRTLQVLFDIQKRKSIQVGHRKPKQRPFFARFLPVFRLPAIEKTKWFMEDP